MEDDSDHKLTEPLSQPGELNDEPLISKDNQEISEVNGPLMVVDPASRNISVRDD